MLQRSGMHIVYSVILAHFGDRQGQLIRLGQSLTRDWTTGALYSSLAKRFNATQHPALCTATASWPIRNSGMGSDVHVWSTALCKAALSNAVLFPTGTWIWSDASFCKGQDGFTCYFGAYTHCALPSTFDRRYGKARYCGALSLGGTVAVRRAATEFLFRRLPDRVLEMADRLAERLLPVPHRHMITVHIRWGDKWKESRLPGIDEYIDAVQTMSRRNGLGHRLQIFLTSESPSAITAFRSAAPSGWQLYWNPEAWINTTDDGAGPTRTSGQKMKAYLWELLGHHQHGDISQGIDSEGRMGLVSLMTLLLAMESRYFVLTTSSNWSRLINELRLSRIEPIYPGSTDMIDIVHGRWR